MKIWDEGIRAYVPVELGEGGLRLMANTPETARRVTGPAAGVFGVFGPSHGPADIHCRRCTIWFAWVWILL